MIITSEHVDVPAPDGGAIRCFVAAPKAAGEYPGVIFYSDIFQLTDTMLRSCARLAGYGFVVAAPEIYRRIEPPGLVIPFDDEGRTRGLEDAQKTPVAHFDADCRADLVARTGQMTFPQVLVGERSIGGFRELLAADRVPLVHRAAQPLRFRLVLLPPGQGWRA